MRKLLQIFFLVLVSGCSLGPNYERPEVALPEHYLEESYAGDSFANLAWLELFKDPVLQDLIRIALNENRNLNVAAARVEEARALYGFTRADQFPRLDLGGTGAKIGPSEQQFLADSRTYNEFGLSANLSYELDFWGRISGATEAARSEVLASEESYRFITISLIAEVAINYFRVLDLAERLAIAKRTVKNRSNATKVINARFEKGVVAEIDLNQAQIEEADAAITEASTERELLLAQSALRVLLGSATYTISSTSNLQKQDLPNNIPTIFPAQLLNRRPDLLAAEQVAKAEVALIGVAQAERLPVFNLLGAIGFGSNQSENLLSRRALTWNIAGQFVGPLIDFGKSRSNVEVAEARAQQALQNYEQNVLLAMQDVEDSLTQIRTYRNENAERVLQVKAASNAARLSRARYDDGFTSYLEVLDIERSLFSSELGASSSKQQYLSSVVRLFKSLGGGWSNTPETAGPLYVEVK